jgi:hypothetical protein
MTVSPEVLRSFHRVLVEEIREKRPDYLRSPFTVAEIYQDLVPYPTHRDRIGVEMNGDYEDALIRLLAGEGGYLTLESEHALKQLRSELQSKNPNTGVYREYAAVDVRLNPTGLNGDSVAASQDVPDAASVGKDTADALPVASPDETVGEEEAAPAAEGEACQWCRAPLPARENLNFCPYCGSDIQAEPCSACGEELEPGWRFCIACGAERSS